MRGAEASRGCFHPAPGHHFHPCPSKRRMQASQIETTWADSPSRSPGSRLDDTLHIAAASTGLLQPP